MAPDIASTRNEERLASGEWTTRISLTRRILAVNIFALAILAGGFFYLDSYRARLIDGRLVSISRETALIAAAMETAPASDRARLLLRTAQTTGLRLRIYDADGTKLADSFRLVPPSYTLRDPMRDPLHIKLARVLDRVVETIALADRPAYVKEPAQDRRDAWPEAREAARTRAPASAYRFAPDRTPFLSVARPLDEAGRGDVLLATANTRDITDIVRAERLRIALVFAAAILVSVLLSLFLARTIVLPLRRLARAAVRVRLGRAREVIVPRLPDRRDEIGMLARAVSDMSQALRQRIDATDAFAADVSHELKNPIASLRSALEGLAQIKDPALQAKLLAIAQDDVRRLDRLVSDIAEATRIDAQLSRTPFETIDLGRMIGRMVRNHAPREDGPAVRLSYAGPGRGAVFVSGDPQKLVRVVDNLIDNARSFSPDGGRIRLTLSAEDGKAIVAVEDEGPGVPESEREAIFRRFHSVRPERDGFGNHSGLGLAIARTILEGHHGSIHVEARLDGKAGARFVVTLPLAEQDVPPPNSAKARSGT
ncbi:MULTISPECIES: stimulus-sensing domain-containing protein [Sphingobium]|uniref:stimulus-sensing domain-containing protein n=1 Tax=Sphingobium TaxID=165695 RepID=UPI0015EBECC1|nr:MULTISPECIES: stimulus-sensing domain-containing protein [Sphingobium]MCW2361575.1 two-component system sensor histidine kinase ChvG [Sphingobium sp. B10D3B]MCW2401746.1 two-component system sensor histidine kinase ChvG [Sphingobium sp. B10D7B]MCW2408725.1 two-component system sensor histidine kinase ChvG [Sphingobium xanthum]